MVEEVALQALPRDPALLAALGLAAGTLRALDVTDIRHNPEADKVRASRRVADPKLSVLNEAKACQWSICTDSSWSLPLQQLGMGMRHLAALTGLTSLAYSSAYIPSGVLVNVVKRIALLTRLRELRVQYCCKDVHMARLSALTRLTSLESKGAFSGLLGLQAHHDSQQWSRRSFCQKRQVAACTSEH